MKKINSTIKLIPCMDCRGLCQDNTGWAYCDKGHIVRRDYNFSVKTIFNCIFYIPEIDKRKIRRRSF